MPPSVGEPVRRLGLQPGFHGRGQRMSRVVGSHPVEGKARRAVGGIAHAGVLSQCTSKGRMQLSTLSRQQVTIERFLGEGVPEGVRFRGWIWNEHLVCDSSA